MGVKCKTCNEELSAVEVREDFCYECDDQTELDLDAEIEKEFAAIKKGGVTSGTN